MSVTACKAHFSILSIVICTYLLVSCFNLTSASKSNGSPPPNPKTKSPKNNSEVRKEVRGIQSEDIIIIKNSSVHSNPSHIHDRSDGLWDIQTLLGANTTAKKSGVHFALYTPQNRKVGQTITNTTTVAETFWNSSQKTYFYIHGYTQSSDEGSTIKIKYFLTSEYVRDVFFDMNYTANIVIVDWHTASQQINYFAAAKDTRIIGEVVGDMLISLQMRGFFNYSQVHLVGFSLGGQISGIAGYRVRKKADAQIARITALDPAGPGFDSSVELYYRLDKTDAEFVDVIHCNAGELVAGFLGTTIICGHVDFFPNGGRKQPGCEVKDSVGLQGCSHMKCPQLYASSIRGRDYTGCPCENNQAFTSGQCQTCNGPQMGYHCPLNATGVYYLKAVPDDIDTVDLGSKA